MMLSYEQVRKELWYRKKTGEFYRVSTRRRTGNVSVRTGYNLIQVAGKTYRGARVAFLWVTGSLPTHVVDHIDCVKHNDAWYNLREATLSENGHNRGKPKSNTSGYKCISFRKERNRWSVEIKVRGVKIHLGYYEVIGDAVAARDLGILQYCGDFGRTE